MASACVAAITAVAGAYFTETIVPSSFDGTRSCLLEEVELTTGTIVLFECSLEINLALGSRWSHVALIVADGSGEPMCVDLTPTTDRIVVQPARAYIRRELQEGCHRVAVRQLVSRNPQKLARRLRAFFERHRGARYTHSYWRPAIQRYLKVLQVPPVHRRSLFCSNLISIALREVGVLALATEEDARNVLPPDFACTLPMMPDYQLEPLTLLRTTNKTQTKKHARRECGGPRAALRGDEEDEEHDGREEEEDTPIPNATDVERRPHTRLTATPQNITQNT